MIIKTKKYQQIKKKKKNYKKKENLTCLTLKLIYIDFPEILLGYPIVRIWNE